MFKFFRKKCICDCGKDSLYEVPYTPTYPFVGIPPLRPLIVNIMCKKCKHVVDRYNKSEIDSIEITKG